MSVNISVNLENLREITDNDQELIDELIEEFFRAADISLSILSDRRSFNGEDEEWRKSAHILKGLGYNLGAEAFGDAAKEAQDCYGSASSQKTELYEKIIKEYYEIKKQLRPQ